MFCGKGYLDEVLTVFEKHKHPFVLVDNLAMRWMGCKNIAQPVSIIYHLPIDRGLIIMTQDVDILVRRSQLSDIVTDILSTGDWHKEKSEERDMKDNHPYADSDTVLRAVSSFHGLYRCLRLWTEDLYFLSVDGPKIEIPDVCAWNTTIVEHKYHPDIQKRMYGPIFVGTQEPGILPPLEYQAKSPKIKVSIFIPTIARYLEARIQQHKRLSSTWTRRRICSDFDLRNFFRYMFFDLPHQQKKILPELSKDGQEHMIYRMQTYKRKPIYRIDGLTMKFIEVKPWESNQETEGRTTAV